MADPPRHPFGNKTVSPDMVQGMKSRRDGHPRKEVRLDILRRLENERQEFVVKLGRVRTSTDAEQRKVCELADEIDEAMFPASGAKVRER